MSYTSFPCAYWPLIIFFRDMSVQILYPSCNWIIFIIELQVFAKLSGYKCHVNYRICKYFLPLCVWPFHFIDDVLWNAKTYNSDKLRSIYVISFLIDVRWIFEERTVINTLGEHFYSQRAWILSREHTGALHMTNPPATFLALITYQSL